MHSNVFDKLRPLVGALFLAGPALLIVSGVIAAVEPTDTSWQGVFGQFGAYCLVPTNLTLAWLIAQRRPNLGAVCGVVGWLGSAAAVQAFSGYFAIGLAGAHVGFDARATLAAMAEAPSVAMMVGGLVGLLVPTSMILLGIGLLVSGAASRVSGAFVACAGVVFVSAQALMNNTGEWISPALLLIGMAPIAWRFLTGTVSVNECTQHAAAPSSRP